MPTHEQHHDDGRQGVPPLPRRLGLRRRCARPGEPSGQGPETEHTEPQLCSGLMSGQRATRFRRTLVVVKRKDPFPPSSLERGSAATRTVVRSISRSASSDELTHISRINRR
jgi:hypothetical protein